MTSTVIATQRKPLTAMFFISWFVLFIGLFMMSSTAKAKMLWSEYDWRPVKEQDGVSLATAKIAGSKFLAIKTEMIVNSDLQSLLTHTLDVDAFPLWVQYCVEAKIVQRDESGASFVQHTVSRPPWPLKRRDVLLDVHVERQSEEQIRIIGHASDMEYPKLRGAIRMNEVKAEWRFTLMDDGQVKVENFIHANPKGLIPPWMNNRLMVDSPLKTLVSLRERLTL